MVMGIDPRNLIESSLSSLSHRHEGHVKLFQSIVWDHFAKNARSFPWRDVISPYNIVVSEIMLQQTTTDRVQKKFPPFIQHFPSFEALANAPFGDVLSFWKGLGYNRRALNLHEIASTIKNSYGGELPKDIELLEQFKGIGKATARSIYTFAFNEPSVFIETNIRTVFLYCYFNHTNTQNLVDDKELLKLVELALDHDRPREWYYALMDFGAFIKKTVGNQNHKSKHYKKQSPFEGSHRQLRGRIIESLLKHSSLSRQDLQKIFHHENPRLEKAINDLIAEGLLKEKNNYLFL